MTIEDTTQAFSSTHRKISETCGTAISLLQLICGGGNSHLGRPETVHGIEDQQIFLYEWWMVLVANTQVVFQGFPKLIGETSYYSLYSPTEINVSRKNNPLYTLFCRGVDLWETVTWLKWIVDSL